MTEIKAEEDPKTMSNNGNGHPTAASENVTGDSTTTTPDETPAPPPTPSSNERGVSRLDESGKILEQLEYYFGDINLPRDKFLQDQMKVDQGWIPMETMLKFNRLSKLTTDTEKIANALKDSHLIDVSEDHKKIRRNPEVPMPENTLEYWQEIKRRTVYVKGFPLDTPLDPIMQFVKQFGEVKNVLMRKTRPHSKTAKDQSRNFKGSVFATFVDEKTAEAFANNKDPLANEFNGKPITKLMQETYWANKSKETKEKREQEKNIKIAKKKQAIEETMKASRAAIFVKGSVLKLQGFSAEGDMPKVSEIKEFFLKFGDEVAFVGVNQETRQATIRIRADKENQAQVFWDKVIAATKSEDGKVDFNGQPLTATVLADEEEQKYWIDFTQQKISQYEKTAEHRKQNKSNWKKGKGGHRDEEGGKFAPSGPRGAKRSGGKVEEGAPVKSKRIVFKDDEEGEHEAENESEENKPDVHPE